MKFGENISYFEIATSSVAWCFKSSKLLFEFGLKDTNIQLIINNF